MRITTTLTLFGITVLAIAVSGLGCNNQAPPPKAAQPYTVAPVGDIFNDIDSAMYAADSLLNECERLLGERRTGVSVDVAPLARDTFRLMSPIETDAPAYIIEQ